MWVARCRTSRRRGSRGRQRTEAQTRRNGAQEEGLKSRGKGLALLLPLFGLHSLRASAFTPMRGPGPSWYVSLCAAQLFRARFCWKQVFWQTTGPLIIPMACAQRLAPPQSKPANCEPTPDARGGSRDDLMSERERQLKEQVAALEEKDQREGLLPREQSILQAFKAEHLKLLLVPMQRRARAHALDYACPPAVRLQDSSRDPSASNVGMEPVGSCSACVCLSLVLMRRLFDDPVCHKTQASLFAAHPLDKLLNTDLSRHPDTQLSVRSCPGICAVTLSSPLLGLACLNPLSPWMPAQRIAPTSVKSQTPVNLRYYDSKKRSFLEELFRHRERFFQFHQKRREREKVGGLLLCQRGWRASGLTAQRVRARLGRREAKGGLVRSAWPCQGLFGV